MKNPRVNFEQLVLDSFGNYVIQIVQQLYPKIVHVPGSSRPEDEAARATCQLPREYLDLIFEKVKGNVFRYSIHKHGCRAIQTGLEVFLTN